MNTTGSQATFTRIDQVQRILDHSSADSDRELLSSFAAVIWPELPDPVLHLDVAHLATLIADAFRFVVHTVPPPFQVYKGAPGLHVRARNSATETIVETHTPHVPFIFESLKNYFQQQGLRLLSAVHPLF